MRALYSGLIAFALTALLFAHHPPAFAQQKPAPRRERPAPAYAPAPARKVANARGGDAGWEEF